MKRMKEYVSHMNILFMVKNHFIRVEQFCVSGWLIKHSTFLVCREERKLKQKEMEREN